MTSGWDDDFVVLPDTTSDEDDIGWGGEQGNDEDRRLLDERPPHWQ